MEEQGIDYLTITDAKDALENSGVSEWFCNFDEGEMWRIYDWMWRNNKSPIETAKHLKID